MKLNDAQLGIPEILFKAAKSAIPTTGIAEGSIAYSTDTDEFGSFDGTTWTWIGVDAAAGTGSLRTLGTGALTAAAGNHAHALTSDSLRLIWIGW